MSLLPVALTAAMQSGAWPRSSVACSAFGPLAVFDGMWLELLQPDNIEQLNDDYLFCLGSLGRTFARHSGEWRVYHGGEVPGGPDLPWLDLDQACVIAIGADHGDDTWVLLDFRPSVTDPRVVFNSFCDRSGLNVVWDELTPTLSAFLEWVASAPRRPLPRRD